MGNSLSKIAFEKGGIIKFESPTIISKQKPSALKTLKEIALAQKSNTLIYGQDFDQKKLPALGLKGEHQKMNASCAIAAINVLNHSGLFQISEKNIKDGLKNAVWKARLQEINQGQFFKILPKNFKLILDGGHNKAGARTISSWLLQENKKLPSKNYLICAMLKDKDSKGFLKIIAAQTEMMVGLKIKDEEKSKTSLEICQIASEINFKNISANDFSDAIEKIKEYHLEKHPKQPAKIIICGSLYLAGQFLSENNTKSYL
ncbi:MAG: dihydrofolate synthase/folylpolyglutamate synthase [Rickettsiales bacterium]